MTRRILWGTVAVALTLGVPPSVLAQDYPASQRGDTQICESCASCQSPGTTPCASLCSCADPGQAAQAAAGTTTPAASDTTEPSAAATDDNNLFSQGGPCEQDASAAECSTPNMIGDSIAPTFFNLAAGTGGNTPTPAAGVGRFKMADDTSPLPQDRVILDYSYYSGLSYGAGAVAVPATNVRLGVNEFEPGFEKTFFNGAASFQLRAPMSSIDVIGSQFGNLGMALKGLVLSQDDLDVSAGMSMNVPTGPGVNYQLTGLVPPAPVILAPGIVAVKNQSVHLLPFVGALWRPSDQFFAQGYVQVDVDASGDGVVAGPVALGRVYDPTLLYLDLGVGYWLRKDDDCSRFVSGLALIGEIHVNESVGTGGETGAALLALGGMSPHFSLVDVDFGVHLDVGPHSNATFAYVTPLNGGPDRVIDGGLRVLYNYTF